MAILKVRNQPQGVKKLDIDHEFTSEVVCPYCGEEVMDSWELDDEGEYECDCGKNFNFERNVEVTYTTWGNCAVNNDKHVWEQNLHNKMLYVCKNCGKFEVRAFHV